jgi:Ca-activated chloride channel family protein
MRKVGYLLDEIRLNGEDRELKEEVIHLATRYGIVTPYTSFLIQEPGTEWRDGREFAAAPTQATPAMSGVIRRRAEAEGGGGFGGGGMMGPGGAAGARDDFGRVLAGEKGEEAVSVSEALEEMKEGDRAYEVRGETAKHAGDKLFYLRDGVWVDSAWPEKPAEGQKTLAVKYDSDAYWTLLSKFPELGPYLALGEKVQVVFEGVLVTVGETGQTTLTEEDLKMFKE